MVKTILLTGGKGFVGFHLLKQLIRNPDYHVVCTYYSSFTNFIQLPNLSYYYIDLTNQTAVEQLFKDYNFDTVIHLAALARPKPSAINEFYDLNLKATHYLLNCCKFGVDFIYASSTLIYGNDGCFYEDDKTNPKNLYAITKLAAEQVINLYYEKGHIRPRVLRLGLVVGPNMTHGRLLEAQKTNEINLTGQSPGDFGPISHISDITRGIISAIDCNRPKVTVNLCNDDYISLEESLKIVNPNIHINWSGTQKPNVLLCYLAKALYELKWFPTLTSKESVEKINSEY